MQCFIGIFAKVPNKLLFQGMSNYQATLVRILLGGIMNTLFLVHIW
jgi:hypothetical protein